jgi:hypothetical protein
VIHFNWRIVKYSNGTGFGLHEVYYNDDNSLRSMSARPFHVGDPADEIRQAAMMANADAHRQPVLEQPTGWAVSS